MAKDSGARSARACPVCTLTATFETALPDVDLYRCDDCGHCFSDLSRAPARETYGPEYYEQTHRNWFEHPNLTLFAHIDAAARGQRVDAAVVDVGCGRGDLLRYLHARNPRYDLTGIDLSQVAPVPGIRILRGDALTLSVNQVFDAVISLAAIEHVEDAVAFARRLLELCAPGGIAIVNTLNERSVLYRTARVLHRLGISGPMVRLYDKHHLHHFTENSLRKLLARVGLTVERTLRHNAPLAAIDFPAASVAADAFLRFGVWVTFVLGRLVRATYLQTVVCRRPVSA